MPKNEERRIRRGGVRIVISERMPKNLMMGEVWFDPEGWNQVRKLVLEEELQVTPAKVMLFKSAWDRANQQRIPGSRSAHALRILFDAIRSREV